MHVVISTDGYVAQDGQAAWAFIAQGEGAHAREAAGSADPASRRGLRKHAEAGALVAVESHLAEWIAMSRALAWAEETLAPGDTLELHTDSALVAKGLASRRLEMSGEAAILRAGCRQALARLGAAGVKARVVRVPREENAETDALAREAAHK